ncbi:MAG: sulfatase [Planctomycetota bacterium]
MTASPRQILARVLGGSALLGLPAGLFFLGAGSWQERLILGLVGAWAAALPLALLLVLARSRLWGLPASAFWMGGVLGLLPFLGSILPQGPVLGLTGLLLLLCILLRKLPDPGRLAALSTVLGGAMTLILLLLSLFPLKSRETSALKLPPPPSSSPRSGPDVILISVDTLRADAVTGPRPKGYTLPTLDRLRKEGVSASYALAPSNQTLPGHVSMLSGLDAMHHGVRFNLDHLPREVPMLAEAFSEAGWRTVGVISNAQIAGELGFSRGFEVYDDATVPSRLHVRTLGKAFLLRTWPGWLAQAAVGSERAEVGIIELLDRTLLHEERRNRVRARTRRTGRAALTNSRALPLLDQLLEQEFPYFLFVHYMDPHDPYGAPAPFQGMIASEVPPGVKAYVPRYPRNVISAEEIEEVEEDLKAGNHEAMEAARFFRLVDLEEVAFVDHCVGEILERVERAERPTVLLLTGDHGEHFGEHDLMKHANSLYEENLRVPFILWGAGVPRGEILPEPPHLEDVVPTLLSLAGLPPGEGEGLSVLQGIPPSRIHVAADNHFFSLRRNGLKWIAVWTGKDSQEVKGLGLFRLREDPREGRNLISGEAPPPELAPIVQKTLSRDQHALAAGGATESQREAFEELGYAE